MKTNFENVLKDHGPALSRIVASYAGPTADREDLLQDVALALWRALPRFRGECTVRTFAFRIAHNRGLDHTYRRRVREGARGPMPPQVHSSQPKPDAVLAGRQASERLLWALRKLPLGQRQVLTLVLEGLGHNEIAEVLGITENNVSVRLHRGRAALAGFLEEENG